MRRLAAFAALLALATPAAAVPPPPPSQADLGALQSFIGGMQSRDLALYGRAFADDVVVTRDGRPLAVGKAQWLRAAAALFAGPDHDVVSERVSYGMDVASAEASKPCKALIVERISRVLGDCCILARTEVLTFRDGKVAAVDRSPEFDLLLRADGHRQDDPPTGAR